MKIGFLITARLKSQRLPLKIIKDLNGKKVVERVIDRAKEIKGISDIVLCTSTNPQDKPLIETAEENNIYYFLGDEDDVLKRLNDAATKHDLDYFSGITADNPLFSIRHANKIVRIIKEKKPDFVKVKNLPIGAATFGMNVKALRTVCKVKNVIDTEIWGALINRPEIFDVIFLEVKGKLCRPNLRLTLDYEEDYKFINHLYSNIKFKKILDLYDVMKYLDIHPEIAKINKNCVQQNLDNEIIRKIDNYFKENYEEIIKIKNEIYKNN